MSPAIGGRTGDSSETSVTTCSCGMNKPSPTNRGVLSRRGGDYHKRDRRGQSPPRPGSTLWPGSRPRGKSRARSIELGPHGTGRKEVKHNEQDRERPACGSGTISAGNGARSDTRAFSGRGPSRSAGYRRKTLIAGQLGGGRRRGHKNTSFDSTSRTSYPWQAGDAPLGPEPVPLRKVRPCVPTLATS